MRTSMQMASDVIKIEVRNIEIKGNGMHAFEHFSHISLHMKIINTFETQQQQGLTVFEEALIIPYVHKHLLPS